MTTTDNKLIITRSFDAPLRSVWKAWTDPEHLKRWWGPKNFTSPFCKLDLHVGGKYLYCMRSKEGQEFWSTGTYKEIIPFERLVCADSFADEKGNAVPASYYDMPGDDWPMELTVTIVLEDLCGKTKMTLTHVGIPAGQMKEMCSTGWNQSFDKLTDSLK
jgi:uncharacterized protein YndB with AHSA1/START domain